MRVALDATYALDPQPTGVARYSRRLIAALGAQDLRLTLAARPKRFPALRREFPGLAHCLLQEPFNLLLPRNVDLFHGLNQRLPRYRFARQVVTVHDLFPLTSERYSAPDFRRRFAEIIRDAVARADAIIAVSAYTRDQLCTHLGLDQARITVVHHGADQAPGFVPRVSGNPFLLTVGSVQVRKNTLTAVKVLEKMPASVRLVVTGGSGYGAEGAYEYVRRQGLGDRVEFLGHTDEATLDRLYAEAALLLFPSLEEGFGFPVLEAMARGLPVVAARAGSLPEICGDAALLADPLDVPGLAEACRRLLEDGLFRQQQIALGRRQAEQFTWEKTARATVEVYRALR